MLSNIPFGNTLRFRKGKNTNFWEIPKIYCARQHKQNTSNLIKKSNGISDLFIGCKHLTKITHKFTKFNENSMEAKSQQNFYNKATIVVISSKLSLLSINFQDLVQKVMKWLIIIHYYRFMLCIAFTLSNNNLAHFHH